MSRPTTTTAALVYGIMCIAVFLGGLKGHDDYTPASLTQELLAGASHGYAPDALGTHRIYLQSTCEVCFIEEDDDFWRHSCHTPAALVLATSVAVHLPDTRQNFAPISLLHFAPKNSPPSLFA